MKTNVNSVIEAAMSLDEASRAKVAQKLLDSLDEANLENEWIDLAEKRLDEIGSGKVTPLTWRQVTENLS